LKIEKKKKKKKEEKKEEEKKEEKNGDQKEKFIGDLASPLIRFVLSGAVSVT